MMDFSKRYNRNEFVKFLQTDFLPEDDFLTETTEAEIQQETKYIKAITRLGACPSLKLAVYEARHTSTNDARVGLSKEIFRFMANKREHKALVLFVPEGNDANYRFSLISIDLNETEDGKIKRTYSNPRRYSYYLGEGIAYYTPNKYLNEAGRVKDTNDLTERFSVEVLTKDFYRELSNWYFWAIDNVSFPNVLQDKTDDKKYNSEAVIRLVTRLIFVWFLKQKHLIPDEFFDELYIADKLLENFNPNAKVDLFWKSAESRYYKAILQNLFFAMLNSPITQEGKSELSERHFRSGRGDYDNNKLMRYETMFKNPQLFVDLANKTVPFLNGGLFDCLDDKDNGNYVDGFSDRKEVQKSLIVPDYLFFGEEVGKNIDLSEWYGDKKKKQVAARGIIDILKRYNFTVEENTPFDQDVSLDPELLGKVFENLLASYNPETQTTARKQTGSFYTPRKIVQYMVDESLVAHLKRTVGDELEPEYRALLQYTDDEVALTDAQKKRIMQSLYTCKILDPACGSGAFPVGMLQQMVHILSRIDPDNARWKEMILDEAANESRDAFQAESKEERAERLQDIERSFDEKLNNPDYARKLYLIENCIYGVDIQPIAIQISKLRFFISLVVDQRTTTDPASNFGIRPLPNLEAKFVAANTLIPLAKLEGNLGRTPEIIATEERLKEANHKIFNAKTVKTKRKWKERLKELRSELIQQLSDNGFLTNDAVNQLASWDMFDQNASASFFNADWMFGIKNGFDIVIGNPPYVLIDKQHYKLSYAKSYKCQEGKIDLYRLFMERAVFLASYRGVISFITPNTFLSIKNCSKLRKFLLNGNSFIFIDNYDKNVFDASVNSVVFLLLKDYMSNTININLHTIGGIETMLLKVAQINSSPFAEINIHARDVSYRIKEKMLSASVLLKDIAGIEMCLGAQPYHNTIHTKAQIDSRFLHSDYQIDKNYVRDFGGKNISKFIIDSKPNKWINYSAEFYTKPDKRFFNGPRIIIREIPSRTLICAYAEKFALFNKSVFNIRCSLPKVNLKYILAILNSRAIGYYVTSFGDKSKQMLFPRVSMKLLKQLPIPLLGNQYPICSLVDEIILRRSEKEDSQILEKQLDIYVYHLYGLTYDEVKIIDPDTPITREEYEK